MPRIPFITTDQMREVDRAMIDDYRIELIQMMENAGRELASVARSRFLGGDPAGRRVLVLAGPGGNGGGGLVCARRLHGWGATVRVMISRPDERFIGVPAHQLDILRRLEVPITEGGELAVISEMDLIVDALVGYGLAGPPRDGTARLIELANGYGAPILSLDAPSGLDTTTGIPHQPTIRATATVTLALPKRGLRGLDAEAHVGELYLADIGVPPELYAGPELDLAVGPIFSRRDVFRIDAHGQPIGPRAG